MGRAVSTRTVGLWRYPRLWCELLGLCWRAYPGRTVGLLVVKALLASNVTVTSLALRATVNGIVHHDGPGAACAAVATAATYAFSAYLLNMDGLMLTLLVDSVGLLHLTRRINSYILGLEQLDHLERSEVLDRITVVQSAGWTLIFGAWTVVDVLAGAVRLALVLVLLSTVNPWLLMLIVFAGVPLWLDRQGQRLVSQAETDTAEAFRLQRHLFNIATEARSGQEIRVTEAGEEIARRQAQAWDEAICGRRRSRIQAAGWKIAGWALFTAGFVGGLAIVVFGATRSPSGIGDVVLAVTTAVTLRESIQSTVFRAGRTGNAGAVIDAYIWLRNYACAKRCHDGDRLPAPDSLRDGITFDHVWFTYPGTDQPALEDLSCRLPSGHVVAIVGEYGSGKTSLVKLLCKFYRPGSGAVSIDGVDLSSLDTAEWRARISAAFQDFGRFQLRFAQTVGLGDLPRLNDREGIGGAVRAADAQRLVQRLPNGLDTQLGRCFDGVELSEGQWQKTALARASMRLNPLLFVLDEPTASLDAPSEQVLFERYIARARDLGSRTGAITVIVSHRFSTVANADLILVLHAGRLVESGTHQDLLASEGRYAKLYGIQMKAYSNAARP